MCQFVWMCHSDVVDSYLVCCAKLRIFLNSVPKSEQDEDFSRLEEFMAAALAAEVLRQRHEKLTYAYAKKHFTNVCNWVSHYEAEELPDAPKMLVTVCDHRDFIDQAKQAQVTLEMNDMEPLIVKLVAATVPFQQAKSPTELEEWSKDMPGWRHLQPSIDQADQQIDWSHMFINGIYHDLFLTLYIKDDAGDHSLLKLVPVAWQLCKALERPPKSWRRGPPSAWRNPSPIVTGAYRP